jgi:hypothetical protein
VTAKYEGRIIRPRKKNTEKDYHIVSFSPIYEIPVTLARKLL